MKFTLLILISAIFFASCASNKPNGSRTWVTAPISEPQHEWSGTRFSLDLKNDKRASLTIIDDKKREKYTIEGNYTIESGHLKIIWKTNKEMDLPPWDGIITKMNNDNLDFTLEDEKYAFKKVSSSFLSTYSEKAPK